MTHVTRRAFLGAAAAALSVRSADAQTRLRFVAAGGGSATPLQMSDLTYLGVFTLPATDLVANTRWVYSGGNITTRRVGGELRIIVSGSRNGDSAGISDGPYEINYPGYGTYGGTAPRATLIRNWGDWWVGGTKAPVGKPGGFVEVRGYAWDEVLGGLWIAYGESYNVALYHDPSIVFMKFHDDAGSFTTYGPWRTTPHSQKTRGFITVLPQAVADVMTGGRRICVGAPPTSGNGPCNVGLGLYALDTFDPTTRPPDTVQASAGDPVSGTLDGVWLANYDGTHPMARPDTFDLCTWADPGNYSTTVGSTSVGATSIAVADTTLYAQAGSFNGSVYRCLIGGFYVHYTGRSTTSGPGNLTGVPTSGTGSVGSILANGTPVLLDGYDNGRGGTITTGDATWSNNSLGIDAFTGVAWVSTPAREGLICIGSMVDTLAGGSYPPSGRAHVCYGPSSGGLGTCPHGQVGYNDGTGPFSAGARPVCSTYSKADLVAAGTGAKNAWDLSPVTDQGNPQTLSGASSFAATIGAVYYMGNIAFDATSGLLFVAENKKEIETLTDVKPIIHVFQVPLS